MRNFRGDTIIEVILAVTVFSAVAMGVMVIMNSGIAMVQRSLEVVLVRQQIDAQAEMLRYVFDRVGESQEEYVDTWGGISIVANPEQLIDVGACPDNVSGGFVFVPSGGGVDVLGFPGAYSSQPDTYAKVDFGSKQSQGISIQLTEVSDGLAGAYDAYIQACWHTPGSTRPMTIGTIVRLHSSGHAMSTGERYAHKAVYVDRLALTSRTDVLGGASA